MGKIIAVTNQKGGVGKTTTSVNLSASLGALGKKVLFCDIDPQGNGTSGFGISKKKMVKSTYNLLVENDSAEEIKQHTDYENVDILPAGMDLAAAEFEMSSMPDRMMRLKQALVSQVPLYDYIIIDCPPSLGVVTINALTAADTFLIPTQCEYYALEGLSQLMSTVRQVKRLYNQRLEIEGVLLTMFDGRLNLTLQVVEEVKKFFPNKVFRAIIPRNVRLSEAPSYGMPVMYFDKNSRGAMSYLDLAAELLENTKKTV